MATYAAFKHVELYNVGKAKKRVLRPPGGGTSDIFGGDSHQTPRPVKNHMKSNIFAHEAGAVKNNVRQGAHRFYFIGDQPRRGQKNIDSYSRLFGEPERPFTPAKNHMKSSIPFGPNSEGAQPVLTNGTNGHNGHNHHTNGKSGSVSSASSSVSSSTENLKMNGISKTAAVETCPKEKSTSTEDIPAEIKSLSMDQPCDDKSFDEKSVHAANIEAGAGDVITQTRRDTGVDAPNPHSLAEQKCLYEKKEEPLESCALKKTLTILRNPITGLGLGEDGVGGWRPIKTKQRDGNPVTGEGYKVDNTPSTPSMNGVNQVINKNRIPPGGYSSGLW